MLPALVRPMSVAHIGAGRAGVVARVDDLSPPAYGACLGPETARVVEARRVVADPVAVATHPPVSLVELHLERHDVLSSAELTERTRKRLRMDRPGVLHP